MIMEVHALCPCVLSSISIVLNTIDTDFQTTRYHIEMSHHYYISCCLGIPKLNKGVHHFSILTKANFLHD